MALAQRFSLVRLGNDRLVSYQEGPSLFLYSASMQDVNLAAGCLLIPRVKVDACPYLCIGP